MNNGAYAFLMFVGTFLTLGLLAAGSIPPLAACVYLACFALPMLVD